MRNAATSAAAWLALLVALGYVAWLTLSAMAAGGAR